jgi:hypothetical protein
VGFAVRPQGFSVELDEGECTCIKVSSLDSCPLWPLAGESRLLLGNSKLLASEASIMGYTRQINNRLKPKTKPAKGAHHHVICWGPSSHLPFLCLSVFSSFLFVLFFSLVVLGLNSGPYFKPLHSPFCEGLFARAGFQP